MTTISDFDDNGAKAGLALTKMPPCEEFRLPTSKAGERSFPPHIILVRFERKASPMIKVLLVATAALVGTASFASAASHKMRSHSMLMKKKKITANGRCGGVSYGTGARRCGDQSGGPSGGNSSRN